METTKRLQLILAATAAILAMIIAFYMGMHFGKSTAEKTAQKSASTASMHAENANESAGSKNVPVADPNLVPGQDYSPSQTDPEVLKLMAAEIHRDKDDLRSLGSPDAPVVLVSYEDFACPMCGVFTTNTHPALKKLVDEGKLRLEFRDMVIFPNYNSQLAHQGARASAQQGKFWEFVDKAFAQTANGNHPNYTKELVLDIAKQAGVENLSAFEKALESNEIVTAVQTETQHAREKLGLTGTPFFIINNAVISGAYPTEYFINTINQQAAEAK